MPPPLPISIIIGFTQKLFQIPIIQNTISISISIYMLVLLPNELAQEDAYLSQVFRKGKSSTKTMLLHPLCRTILWK